jgi:hypothetical protein
MLKPSNIAAISSGLQNAFNPYIKGNIMSDKIHAVLAAILGALALILANYL